MSLGFQVIYAGRSCRYLAKATALTMLASGVYFPGMRNGRVWRHGRRTVRGNPRSLHFSIGHYLRNRSTLDIGVLGYIGVV